MDVLCVDDNEELLDLTEAFLGEDGTIKVTPVTSASSAIELLRKKRFDAIISDYHMPEMHGMDFLKTLRKEGDKTPFIFLTSSQRDEVVKEAVECGANSFIQRGTGGMAAFTYLRSAVIQLAQEREMGLKLAKLGQSLQSAVCGMVGATALIRSGRLTCANSDSARLFGYEHEDDLMDGPVLAGVLPELQDEALDRLLKIELRRTSNFIHVMSVQRANGSRFKALIKDIHIQLEDGPACLVRCWDVADNMWGNSPHRISS